MGNRILQPLAAAVADARARYNRQLAEVAAFALRSGRSCDLDAAALWLDLIEAHRVDDGIRLTRPDVTCLLQIDVRNRCSLTGVLQPADLHVHLWTVLRWLVESDLVTRSSDPVGALLEPLRCYGGLDADGHPMPPGDDVDFPCQCYLPHDPTCPPGLADHIIGRDPETGDPRVVRAHVRLRRDEPRLSDVAPLVKYLLWDLRRRREERGGIDDYVHVGRIDSTRSTPELWLYTDTRSERWGADDLALDADGGVWRPKRDRGRKAGFRWVQSAA